MEIAATSILISLILLLVFLVGGVFLQIFLSRCESRWPGLILPILSFLFSLIPLLSIPAFGTLSVNGAVQKVVTYPLSQFLPQMLLLFVMGNIPTLILLAIYRAARKKRGKRSELDKMHLDDL